MPTRAVQTGLLDTDVSAVRFAHGKRLLGLHELGILSIRDLLTHYPFRYDDFSKVVKVVNLPLGQKNAVLGTIHEAKGRRTAKGGFLYEIAITDGTGVLKAVWFNQKWLADTLTVGKTIMLLGKVEHHSGYARMTSPLHTLVTSEPTSMPSQDHDKDILSVDSGPNPVGIAPVYRANGKVSSNWIKRIVLESRKLILEPLDPLPPAVRIKHNLVSRQIAWQNIHTPSVQEDYELAHRRLAYEQVFFAQLSFAFEDVQSQQGLCAYTHTNCEGFNTELAALLPFELTDSQQRAINDLYTDMASPKRMNRLLLGDVGSGKTVVALHALLAVSKSGWQAAMMAPTEVLAQQYASSLGPILDALGVSWTMLTSALSAKDRKEAYAGLATGDISIALGTHALIEPEVTFKTLSLIVIDEQHRFGVEHRHRLIAKSPAADFFSMTATPIPRSLALVLYGSVQASYLAHRPSKAATHTYFLDSALAYKAYEAVRKAIRRGEQAFIVCPFISAQPPGDDEDVLYLDDLEHFSDEPYITAAETELLHLRSKVFPEYRIELLTSRVKSEDKKRIMSDFKLGVVNILVSTTVIEVGVDVPNATTMIILDANRFGLAQLHQLRGRVGRGTKDSQVFLVAPKPGESARRRLRTLEKVSDGFKLAEVDLGERREGDIAGTRQHGAGSLSLVNVIRDSALIEAAHGDVVQLLEEDPALTLSKHLHLRQELFRMQGAGTN
ncbi:MAG: ATP-dependent DNA helicase RecG [Coriobacteriia bacterium]|nr:ATP-dependent DNA helicase RecG [Coriobacteriia bacterium]